MAYAQCEIYSKILKKNVNLNILLPLSLIHIFVSEKDPSQYKIAVLIKGTAEWFDRLELGVKKFSEDYGVNAVMIEPANPDAASQLEMLDSLLTQDYDAICVCLLYTSHNEIAKHQ